MAKRNQLNTDAPINVRVTWPPQVHDTGESLFDSTVGRLLITVGTSTITAYRSDKGDVGTEIEVPVYRLAEWMADNWWALLHEPQKDDDEDKADFRSRHWLGAARDGFALPDLWIVPTDDHIELRAKSSHLRFSRITFLESITEIAETSVVSAVLSKFVQDAVDRLSELGETGTNLHDSWKRILETEQSSHEFCRLVGSLGLSPYENNQEIEAVLDRLAGVLDGAVLKDLCQAATPADFRRHADTSERIWKAVKAASNKIDISGLADIDCPTDRTAYAWQWGVEGVKRVRKHLGFAATREGADEFFDALGIDPDRNVVAVETPVASQSVTGGVERSDEALSVALVDDKDAQRRFTAARATFLGWLPDRPRARLVTGARTRDQQASRAFAAELLAPIAYIRTRARDGLITRARRDQIAGELNVSPWVVTYQAMNNRLTVDTTQY